MPLGRRRQEERRRRRRRRRRRCFNHYDQMLLKATWHGVKYTDKLKFCRMRRMPTLWEELDIMYVPS